MIGLSSVVSCVAPKCWSGPNQLSVLLHLDCYCCSFQEKTDKEHEKQVSNILKKEQRKRKKLKDLGIDYEFPGYVSCKCLPIYIEFCELPYHILMPGASIPLALCAQPISFFSLFLMSSIHASCTLEFCMLLVTS